MSLYDMECGNCGETFNSLNPICSKCGSTKISYSVTFEETFKIHDRSAVAQKRKGVPRGPIKKVSVGYDKFESQNKWVSREMIVDRENDLYEEVVVDTVTGEEIHHCKEPLSEHRGHGSAKFKK